jgi:hypothetical protein
MFLRRVDTSIAQIVVLLLTAPLPAATTIWDFNSNLNATSGYAAMSYRDAATQSNTTFGTTNGSSVPNIEGQQTGYMSFPMSGNTGGFNVNRPLSSPSLNAYTLAWDMLVPASSFNGYGYMGLFNTTPAGTDDAELFIELGTGTNAGRLFADRDSDNGKLYTPAGKILPNTWHRVVWAFDQGNAASDIRIYVDGVKVAASDAVFGKPEFALPDTFPIFQDGGTTDHAPGLVASAALVDRSMTDAEIAALGGPKANGFASISIPGAPPAPTPAISARGFNVVFFPDTQYETESMPAMYQSQVNWIVNNRASQKIAYVGHLGDITDNGTESENITAHNIMFQLNNVQGMPWGTAPGNHDMNTAAKAALYNQYFGPANFVGKDWYGAATSQLSSYNLFNAQGRKYLVLNLEYSANSTVLAWAQTVINANPGIPTIVNTHMYFAPDGTYEPYAATLWNGLVNNNSQIFMVVCGHHDSQGPKFNTRNNAANKPVLELMTDYQQTDLGGGFLRLLDFDEENSLIRAAAYSPYFQAYHNGFQYDQFDMPLNFDARLGLAAMPGDANDDNQVDEADAQILQTYWGAHVTIGDWTKGDFDDDGVIGAADNDILLAHWTVPEPSTFVLLLGALLAVAIRRRKGAAD